MMKKHYIEREASDSTGIRNFTLYKKNLVNLKKDPYCFIPSLYPNLQSRITINLLRTQSF